VSFECYRIGDLLLDAGTKEVTRNGALIPIPRLSFNLLLSLARHAPNVVSTEQLEKEVWTGLVINRGTVNKRVLLLRKALREEEGGRPYIAVIRGSGYRLVAQVERLDPPPDEVVPEKKSKQNLYQRSAGAIRTISYWLLGIVAVLVLYKGFQNTGFNDVETGVGQDAAVPSQSEPVVYSQKSIAVLPFADLGHEHNYQYLGDGIAGEVINLLAGMNGLAVAARTSSFAFRNTALTTQEIAGNLKVGAILEGNIRSSGERIRVSAQLIDAQSGYQLWSQNYDRDFDEVFEVQDDIASNIAQSLKLTLDENGQPDSSKSMTADMEAFRLYLKGRELLNDHIHVRSESLYKSLEYFNKAIEKDPKFAKAHAGMATVYWLLTTYDSSLEKETYLEQAEACAEFALEIDPASTDAMSALASIHAVRGEIEDAANFFDQIRAIDNTDTNIVSWEAMLHLRLGYFEELITPLTELYRRDPFNEHVAWSLADALAFSGQGAEAVHILRGLKHFAYRDYGLGLSAIYAGDYALARKLLRDVRMRSGVLPAVYADWLVDALEDPSLKEETAAKVISAADKNELDKVVGFEALLILGSPRAFDLSVDPVKDINELQLYAIVWNNWAVDLRRDPRFKDWVKAMGYVDFWRKHGWPDRCRPTRPDDFECI
jgi:TolB-like protein/DNA-binding winged helix-turn-helix (wHTH) protein